MQEPPQIRNPSITLYPFHLRNDADEGYQQPAQNADILWNNLADNVGDKFNCPELKSLRYNLICYQNGQYYPSGENESAIEQKLLKPNNGKPLKFQPITQPNNLLLYGSIEARRIRDTYTADLTFYYKNAAITVDNLKQFNPENCLLADRIQASLGQTLLLYAEPVVSEGYRALAGECVRAVAEKSIEPKLNLTAAGKLFGSPIFEYDNPARKCHILVWLQENPDTLKSVTPTFNYYLLNLLCARSKILFMYDRAKESYRRGQQIASELEKQLPEFAQIEAESNREVKLAKLKALLAAIRSKLFESDRQLRNLREFSNTIEINAENYAEACAKIKALSIAGDDLGFLLKFRESCSKDGKYQKQIQKDLTYLMVDRDLFQQAISTIRGMVEIEQVELNREQEERERQRDRQQMELYRQQEAEQKERDRQQMELYRQNEEKEKKRDRQLENIIFFVGTAIGGGQIFSASYPLIKEKPIRWTADFSLPLHPFTASIIGSLLFGFAFGLLVLGIRMFVGKLFPDRR